MQGELTCPILLFYRLAIAMIKLIHREYKAIIIGALVYGLFFSSTELLKDFLVKDYRPIDSPYFEILSFIIQIANANHSWGFEWSSWAISSRTEKKDITTGCIGFGPLRGPHQVSQSGIAPRKARRIMHGVRPSAAQLVFAQPSTRMDFYFSGIV